MSLRKVLPLVLVLLCGCGISPSPVTPPVPPSVAPLRGGSNILSYQLGVSTGVIADFDIGQATISAQLRQMYAGGQRRLKLPILFYHDAADGIALNSTNGMLTTQQAGNLTALLTLIQQIGFQEVEVQFLPEWKNDPANWTNPGDPASPTYGTCVSTVTNPDGTVVDSSSGAWYSENWNFVVAVRPILRASGLTYSVDLGNEMVMPRYATYARRLWSDYVYSFGFGDTVGFSIVPTTANIQSIHQIYGYLGTTAVWPQLPMDVHIYDGDGYGYPCNVGVAGDCEYKVFVGADRDLTAQGYTGSITIGEGYYNDDPSAQALSKAIKTTGRRVHTVMQWVLDRSSKKGDVQNVLPLDFGKYIQYGF